MGGRVSQTISVCDASIKGTDGRVGEGAEDGERHLGLVLGDGRERGSEQECERVTVLGLDCALCDRDELRERQGCGHRPVGGGGGWESTHALDPRRLPDALDFRTLFLGTQQHPSTSRPHSQRPSSNQASLQASHGRSSTSDSNNTGSASLYWRIRSRSRESKRRHAARRRA